MKLLNIVSNPVTQKSNNWTQITCEFEFVSTYNPTYERLSMLQRKEGHVLKWGYC